MMTPVTRYCLLLPPQVLSISNFLHDDDPRDPLVVKARQRRATAYRALQQLDRAVVDLEAAVAGEPGNTELKKLLAVAQRDLEEQRKQKQVGGVPPVHSVVGG